MADNTNPTTDRAVIFPGIHPDARASRTATSEGVDRSLLRSRLDEGDCPWCDEYEGDNPRHHAPKAHPDEWAALTEERDE